MPWDWVLQWLSGETGDIRYWTPNFRRPCDEWKMDGRKGKPATHADELLGEVVPGQASAAHNGGGGGRQKTNPPNDAGADAPEEAAKAKWLASIEK